MDRVQVTKDGNWAIGQDDKEYVDDWKPQLNDIYRVSTTTGERTPIIKGQERTLGLSPDGKYLLYWKDKQRLGVRHRGEQARRTSRRRRR